MAMGNTGTVNVTPEMINNAKDAIQEYKDTVKTLYSQLEDTMSALIPGNFNIFTITILSLLQIRMLTILE